MATTKKTPRTTQKAKIEALEAENKMLRRQVASLTEVNNAQLQRLVGEDLLRAHISELKAKLPGGSE